MRPFDSSQRTIYPVSTVPVLRNFVLLVWLAALALSFQGCSGGDLGDSCTGAEDCDSELHCFQGVCTHECETPFDCGDGYLCTSRGECLTVESEIGDSCDRELACGPGQACLLDSLDADSDGLIEATCQVEIPGAGTGTPCETDQECRVGICALGRCTQLCLVDTDCPLELACVQIPRSLAQGDASYLGCTQGEGVLRMPIPVDLPFQEVEIPVPSHARSFTLVMQVETGQHVGMARLTGPDDAVLYATPFSPQEYLDNPIRYQPGERISAAMIPNSPSVALGLGIYRAEIGSFLAAGGVGTAVPRVEVLYKLDDAMNLDLHFYFLNLEDHPCESGLDAEAAMAMPAFQDYVEQLSSIFADAGITTGEITYEDILDRPDLDGLATDDADLGSLASLADERPGLHVFFVRSLDPVGIQALATGVPGPPLVGNTPASAVAVGVDTLCYRSWSDLARRSAHAMAQHMGLFDSIAPDGTPDPIPDSGVGGENLMYFSEFGGIELTEGQASVLAKWAGLR